jgi:hypothetical protein
MKFEKIATIAVMALCVSVGNGFGSQQQTGNPDGTPAPKSKLKAQPKPAPKVWGDGSVSQPGEGPPAAQGTRDGGTTAAPTRLGPATGPSKPPTRPAGD